MKKFLSVLTTGANQHPCCLRLAGTSLCRRCLFLHKIPSAPNSLFHAFSFALRQIYTSFYQLFKKRSVKKIFGGPLHCPPKSERKEVCSSKPGSFFSLRLFTLLTEKNRLPHFCDSLQILSLFYVRATLLPLRLRFRTFLR